MKRWFYTLHLHTNTVSIFPTSEYGPSQGYDTEREAVVAAIKALEKEIAKRTSTISSAAHDLSILSEEFAKLHKRLHPPLP